MKGEWIYLKTRYSLIRQPPGVFAGLQDWRLTEAEIDGFCHFWYDGIVGQHGVWTRYVSDPPCTCETIIGLRFRLQFFLRILMSTGWLIGCGDLTEDVRSD